MKKRILHALLCALILATQSYAPCRADDTSPENTQEESYLGRLYNKVRGTENNTQVASSAQDNGDALNQNQEMDSDADNDENDDEEDGIADKIITGVEEHPGFALGAAGIAALVGAAVYSQKDAKKEAKKDKVKQPNADPRATANASGKSKSPNKEEVKEDEGKDKPKDKDKVQQPNADPRATANASGSGGSGGSPASEPTNSVAPAKSEEDEEQETVQSFFTRFSHLVSGNTHANQVTSLLSKHLLVKNVELEVTELSIEGGGYLMCKLNGHPCALRPTEKQREKTQTVCIYVKDQLSHKWVDLTQAVNTHPLKELLLKKPTKDNKQAAPSNPIVTPITPAPKPASSPAPAPAPGASGSASSGASGGANGGASVASVAAGGDGAKNASNSGGGASAAASGGASSGASGAASGAGAGGASGSPESDGEAVTPKPAEVKADDAGYDSETDSGKSISDHVLVYSNSSKSSDEADSIVITPSLGDSELKKVVTFAHKNIEYKIDYKQNQLFKVSKGLGSDDDIIDVPIAIDALDSAMMQDAHLATRSYFKTTTLAALGNLDLVTLSKLSFEQQYKVMCAMLNLVDTLLHTEQTIEPTLIKRWWVPSDSKKDGKGYLTIQDKKKKILGRIEVKDDGSYAIQNGTVALTRSVDPGVKALLNALAIKAAT